MRKWIILAVLVLLLAGGAALALANLNSYLNSNKEWLAEQVEGVLGRQVGFDSIGVSLLGGFGAEVSKLRVADDAAFSREDFVRADKVYVLVNIFSALFGRYEVRRIVLEAPRITVIRTAQGFNFDSLGRTGAQARQAQPDDTGVSGGAGAASVLVSTMKIRNAAIRYVDRTTTPPFETAIRQLDFSATDFTPTTPTRVSVSAAVLGATTRNLTVAGTIGPIGPDLDPAHVPFDIEAELRRVVIDTLKRLPAIAGALPTALSSADPFDLQATIKGTLDWLSVEASLDGAAAAIQYGGVFTKPGGVPLALDIAAQRSGTTIDVERLDLRLAALHLTAQGQVTTTTPPAVDLAIKIGPCDLGGWDRLVPALAGNKLSGTLAAQLRARGALDGTHPPRLSGTLTLRDVKAHPRGAPELIGDLSATLTLDGDTVVLPRTRLTLGGAPVELQTTVNNFRSPSATFTLQAPALPLASLGAGAATADREEVLRELTIEGTLETADTGPVMRATVTSASGSARNVDYRNLRADFSFKEGVASLRQLQLQAFNGSYSGRGRYVTGDDDPPRFDFRSAVQAMELDRLLGSQFPEAASHIEGRLQTDITVAGSGDTWTAIQKTLRGNGRIDVTDGVLKDINIAESVLTGLTGITGLTRLISPRVRRKHPELFGSDETPFDELGGTARIAGGRLTTDDLTLAARDYTLRGAGSVAFDKRVDFTATLIASEKLTANVIADVKEARYLTGQNGRLEIPFRLTGTLPRVRAVPDREIIARALQRALIGKGIDELLGRKKRPRKTPGARTDPAEELIRRGLEGLFGH